MASLTGLMTEEHSKLEAAAARLARLACVAGTPLRAPPLLHCTLSTPLTPSLCRGELALEAHKFVDFMSSHCALEEELINPRVASFYGGEAPKILKTLGDMDMNFAAVTPLLLSFTSSADSLKGFAAALQTHDAYEVTCVLPGLDSGLANSEKSALLVALNERLSQPIPEGARRDLTGGLSVNTNHGGMSLGASHGANPQGADHGTKPRVIQFSGPGYPFAK